MTNRIKNSFYWLKEVIRLSISVFLKGFILVWYSLLIYPCQILLLKLNKEKDVKGEDKTDVKRGDESKRDLKINGTQIYHILYNKQRKGDGEG